MAMLKSNYNVPCKMQISYGIANAYNDLRVLSQDNNEPNLEKEIYYLRNALDMYESNFFEDEDDVSEQVDAKVARYIAMSF